MLLSISHRYRTVVRGTEGTAVNGVLVHVTRYFSGSHSHPSGLPTADIAGRITNHNQNITADVANSSDSNRTMRVDGMASGCNLQREREELIVSVVVFVVRTGWRGRDKYLGQEFSFKF
jgi:hypothetical protein